MSNIHFDFNGKTVIVTGAARGIGAGIAEYFTQTGADVTIVDLDHDALATTAVRIGATPAAADISDTSQVDKLIQNVRAANGRIDIVVNNAGVLRDAMLWKLTDSDWETVLAVHAGGTFKMTRAAIPAMREQGAGRIINVTSYSGMHGNIGQANYATAKAGIIGFTKTAAKELARFGITVNAISPNADTRMIDAVPGDRRREIEALIPLGRFAAPTEMAPAVAVLASEEASYITGVVLPVDGGIAI